MNFIKHFLGLMDRIAVDERLTPHHVSLYVTLFHVWNLNHFRNPVSIARSEMMHLSKIGSVNTYLRCLKELSQWGYLTYEPSFNAMRGSKVYLYRFYGTFSFFCPSDLSAYRSEGHLSDSFPWQINDCLNDVP